MTLIYRSKKTKNKYVYGIPMAIGFQIKNNNKSRKIVYYNRTTGQRTIDIPNSKKQYENIITPRAVNT